MKKVIFALLVMSTFITCKKDKPANPADAGNQPAPKTNKDRLLAGKWKLERFETTAIVAGDTMTMDITYTINQCNRDDHAIYEPNGNKVDHSGTELCYSGQPPTDTLKTWWMPEENILTEHDIRDNYDLNWDIEELSDSSLRISEGVVTQTRHRNTMYFRTIP